MKFSRNDTYAERYQKNERVSRSDTDSGSGIDLFDSAYLAGLGGWHKSHASSAVGIVQAKSERRFSHKKMMTSII